MIPTATTTKKSLSLHAKKLRVMTISTKRIFVICVSMLFYITLCATEVDEIMSNGQQAIEKEDYSMAIMHYEKLLGLYERGVKDSLMCKGLEYGGNCCTFNNRFVEALHYYTLAIECAEKDGNTEVSLICTNNIGNIYALFNDYERAIFYYEKAHKNAIDKKNEYMISTTSTNLVKAYCNIGKVDQARRYLSVQMQHSMKDKSRSQYSACLNQGLIAKAEKNYRGAEYFFIKAYETVISHQLSEGFNAEVNYELGKVYFELEEKRKAIEYFNLAVKYGTLGNTLDVLDESYRALSDTYNNLGMQDSASYYQSLYLRLSDSIFNKQKFNKVNNDLFEYENRITIEHIGDLNSIILWLAIAVIFIMIVLGIFFYYHSRLRLAHRLLIDKNKDLIRQNDESRRIRKSYQDQVEHLQNQLSSHNYTLKQEDQESSKKISNSQQSEPILNEETKIDLEKRILAVMDRIDVISNPEFNLPTLAKMVDSNTKYVSLVINEAFCKNFKTFLNEYRIREASRRLIDEYNYGNLTISAIAETVGFTSLNGFTNAFKKIVGVTPSVYKRLTISHQPFLEIKDKK